ncbi:glycoside hydrolase [Aspergillus homomorphus CBS 101889]|uniref:beta-glucosidase n=1 Tax=Aspergillus homomorphus (strain CBS 101889) TaxID=1450537 RepID=A0A395HV52_ASPHC|nr:glycoside hydrolase [Aspergillus homomorphus CBS 101889]RAL11409.1 glycoside hydrolase [Aspergillus homomorphus CBS 101889]
MRPISLAVTAALLGLTGASSSSTLGLLKANGVALGDWEAAYEKASAFVAGLTTDQKLALITGSSVCSSNGSFSALEFLDGDMGLQNYFYVSAFSLSSALAMTWDHDAIYAQAKAVGSEFYNKGIQVVAGPTSQPMGRSPWGGRNVEGFGPDPYLNGLATGLSTKGYVDAGAIPGGKHFLLYEQETNRTSSGGGGGPGGGGGGGMPPGGMGFGGSNSSSPGPQPSGSFIRRDTVSSDTEPAPYSSNADDKTLHETYLWPFYDAVKNGLGAVMCAMTKVNGTYSCENSDLLMKTLKTELGFLGLVWPDINGQNSAEGPALGGEDYGSSSVWRNSIVDLLYGAISPSGRLVHTIAKNESDYNVELCYTAQCDFTEGVYIDYRYFDAKNVTPRYPFGHGISYTTFKYSDLAIKTPFAITKAPQGNLTVGGNSDLWDIVGTVSARITNSGMLAGAEIPQLYLGFPDAADQPVRQLRGFDRVELRAEQETIVTFNLRRRDISYWDVAAQQCLVASGKYKVYVGASSRDLRLNGTFSLRKSISLAGAPFKDLPARSYLF